MTSQRRRLASRKPTWAAYKESIARGLIKPGDRAVLFNCADGRKYPLPDAGAALDRHGAIDYARL